MINLKILNELRDKEELTKYFNKNNIKISDTEIERLKNGYQNIENQNNLLSSQQLDKVIGGVIYQRAFFSSKYELVKGTEFEDGISFYKHRFLGFNCGLVKLTKENATSALHEICIDYHDDSRMGNTSKDLSYIVDFIRNNYDTSAISGEFEVKKVGYSNAILVECGENKVALKLGEKSKSYTVGQKTNNGQSSENYNIEGEFEPKVDGNINPKSLHEVELNGEKIQYYDSDGFEHIKFPNAGYFFVEAASLYKLDNGKNIPPNISYNGLGYQYIMDELRKEGFNEKTQEYSFTVGNLCFFIAGKNYTDKQHPEGIMPEGFMVRGLNSEERS